MSGEKTKRPWTHPVSNAALAVAATVGMLASAAGAPPVAVVLWIWAFVMWRKRRNEENTARGAIPADGQWPAVADPEPMAGDPRSAWAYRRFTSGSDTAEPISPILAARVLDMLEPGDHIELIADAVTRTGWGLAEVLLQPRLASGNTLVIRTLRAWIVVDRRTGRITACSGASGPGRETITPDTIRWPNSGWAAELTAVGGARITVKLFLDRLNTVDFDIIENGAGAHIRRLPESPDVPAAPDPETLALAAHPPILPGSLPTDWNGAEEIAAAHMQSIGFADAELTGGSRDGGVDVTSALAVAQVKMQALPVGAPSVQQLRGTRPEQVHHLFYATSGYTGAALEAAEKNGVALFAIGRTGTVEAVNDAARVVERAAGEYSGIWSDGPTTQQWAQTVVDRITGASEATDDTKAVRRERFPGQWKRIASYKVAALQSLVNAPGTFESVQSAIIYYHHTELLAAVYFRELGIPYPQGAGDKVPDSLDEFYS